MSNYKGVINETNKHYQKIVHAIRKKKPSVSDIVDSVPSCTAHLDLCTRLDVRLRMRTMTPIRFLNNMLTVRVNKKLQALHAHAVAAYLRKDSRYVVVMSTSQSDFFRQKVFNFKLEPDNTVCADCGKDGKKYVHAGVLFTWSDKNVLYNNCWMRMNFYLTCIWSTLQNVTFTFSTSLLACLGPCPIILPPFLPSHLHRNRMGLSETRCVYLHDLCWHSPTTELPCPVNQVGSVDRGTVQGV